MIAVTTGTEESRDPRCADCGQPIRPGRAPGTWVHRTHVVAACDLDADHPAVPDGAAAAEEGPAV
jgi:hypothetical protein